jgi:methyltransferase (TIGR00027 family)
MSRATATPDSTAVRTALWRALHLEVDAPPHVLDDRIGLQLAAPDPDWRQRPDMNEYAAPGVRASIVARARFIEDLVIEQADHGVGQHVLLGAGLDTFAQRRPEIASRIMVFEVDRPEPQAWKRQRLDELGFGVPERLRLVPVDFELLPGGTCCWPTASTRISRPSLLRSACPCTSPGMPRRRHCAKAPRWQRVPR